TGNTVDDWIRLFNARSQEELDMIAIRNESMREAVEAVKELGLFRTLRWIYDDYWKAKRDRWAEDEYVREEGIAIGLKRGKAEDILHLLENMGEREALPESLVKRIESQKDEETLKRWLLSAAKVESLGQFMEQEGLGEQDEA
ncbi:MAG: Rpn family recombination-promoting nuclease/putative transposase, partial [Lachnospiraceae bacterium]|nr:Rpn family recombination-promoting nuclease/putative transposase [Lachnospiraceae bacterium]